MFGYMIPPYCPNLVFLFFSFSLLSRSLSPSEVAVLKDLITLFIFIYFI